MQSPRPPAAKEGFKGRPTSAKPLAPQFGWVAEWLKAPVLKTGRRETVSWVRIPPHPPRYYFHRILCIYARKSSISHHRVHTHRSIIVCWRWKLLLRQFPTSAISNSNTLGSGAGSLSDQPSVSFTASTVLPTIWSASERFRQSGGAKPRISPCGMARTMTPRLSKAAATAVPTLPAGSKNLR